MGGDNDVKPTDIRESLIAKETAEVVEIEARVEDERRKTDAEVEKSSAETAKSKAEERKTIAEASIIEIALAKTQRQENEELALNKYNQVYMLTGEISEGSVRHCISQLTEWHRLHPDSPIEIVFNSPGGDITNGLALFDYIRYLSASGHVITTVALGMAASMAGILLQAGDKRVMGREAWVLIHEASFGTGGKIGEVEDRVEWIKKVQDRILAIFAARSDLSVAQLRNRWKRKDWWLSSADCEKFKLVDEVR